MSTTAVDVDVAIVGYGPVGQTLAALLGQAGHSVAAYDRFGALYPLPRAVHFDDEIMRCWQQLGIVDDIADDLLPAQDYLWFGADGDPILTIETTSRPGPSGWPSDYLFFQPLVEVALVAAARRLPTVRVERHWSAARLEVHADDVELTLRRVEEPEPGRVVPTDGTRTVRARYVIGADGANSFVRDAAGIVWEDHGFAEQWLTLDVLPKDMSALAHLPTSCQWCDPERPHMHTRNGQRHRRWEFMLLPGEQPADFAGEDAIWSLLAPWITPSEGTIIRHAVYEFRSRLADRMDAGRVLLAGDAAHLMPPFMGQGLCAGIRDAVNVAWKLDLILRDLASPRLLETYTPERRGQNEWIVNVSTEMGRVSCERDPAAAAERDAILRAADAPPPIGAPPLATGLLQRAGSEERGPLVGALAVQGTVAGPRGEGRFDDVVGPGFALVTLTGDPRADLGSERVAFLDRLGAQVASLDPAAPGGIRDLDGRLTGWLAEHGVHAVLSRPDFYVFGTAQAPDGLAALVDDLRAQLEHPATDPAAPAAPPE